VRSTIDIDENLIREAMKLTNARTKKNVVRISLENLIRQKRRERLKGKLGKYPLELTPAALEKMRGAD